MKRVFIVTDYHYISDDLSVTRSEHYCFEIRNPKSDTADRDLFDECRKQLPDKDVTVCEWYVEEV